MAASIDLVALVASLSDAQHAALKVALRARVTPEQAAASDAYVGKGYACAVTPSCGRVGFRTAKRAGIHGVDAGGHIPASA